MAYVSSAIMWDILYLVLLHFCCRFQEQGQVRLQFMKNNTLDRRLAASTHKSANFGVGDVHRLLPRSRMRGFDPSSTTDVVDIVGRCQSCLD
jgi:hypothetical protein